MRLTTSHCKNKGVQKRHTGPQNWTDNLERPWQRKMDMMESPLNAAWNLRVHLGSIVTPNNDIQTAINEKLSSAYRSLRTINKIMTTKYIAKKIKIRIPYIKLL